MTPFEIIGAPFTVYIAPIGTTFPLINVVPAVAWIKLGTNGDRNYSNDGVTVSHAKTYQKVRPAGATGPVKAFLDEEDLMIRLTLWDMTLEQYAYALNSNTVGVTAAGVGTAGFKKIGLSQSVGKTKEFALLVRGPSPYDEAMSAQYEVPRCYDSGSAEPVFRNGAPAGLALELTALEDLGAASQQERFGRFVAQHQNPLP